MEELKRQKIARAEEAEKAKVDAERRRLEDAAIADFHRRKEKEREQEQARTMREQQQMHAEDILVSDNRARFWEVKRMEHEDIRSFMREKHDAREAVLLKEKVKALKDLYRPFDPFPAELATDHMLSLKELLQNEPASVDQIYKDVMDTLSQSSSHRSRIDQKTESVDRKRSSRYIRIYEGIAGLPTTDAESVAATQLSSKHNLGLDTSYGEGVEVEEEEESRKPVWLRKPQSPPVRELSHSPTKHTIRAHGSSQPNPYDAQWNLLQGNSAQCFVRTSGESFRPAAEPLPTMRKLSSLGPILRPLEGTSMFEVAQEVEEDLLLAKPRRPLSAAKSPAVVSHEAEILRKFGAPHPAMAAKVEDSAQEPENSVPAASPAVHVITDSFFDDSLLLESNNNSMLQYEGMNGSPLGNRLPFQPPDPSHSHTDAYASTASVKYASSYFSQIMPIENASVDLPTEASTENLTFNASFNSSVFRSLSPSNDSAGKGKTHKAGRKKLKTLLSTSADTIAKTDQKEWLQFLQTQRKATFASLSTMDAKAAALKSRFDQTHAQVAASMSEKALQNRPVTPKALSEVRQKTMQVAQLKKELQELGIVDESILDFKTRQMAKSASESVIRMQAERAMLRQYVSSGAVLRDEFYLMAVEPTERRTNSLEVSAEVKKFAETITRQLDGGEELTFPSILSTEALPQREAAGTAKLPRSAAKTRESRSREPPKASLKFGIYEPANLFMEQADVVPVKPPDVALDLGVKQLSRGGLQSTGGAANPSSAGIPRKVGGKKATRGQREPSLTNFQSLQTISTLSAGSLTETPNPFGVIRGNPVLVSAATKETPITRAHRKAGIYSVSSAGSLQQVTSLNASHSELGKKGSTLSKSVELFINTPTPRRSAPFSAAKDLEEESVGSGIEDQKWQHHQGSAAPFTAHGEGSVMSFDSASIVLD